MIAALAAAPAGALAQDGAGDDQYTDPFGETTPQGGTETTITPTPAPAPTPAPDPAPNPAPGAQRSAPAPTSSAAAPAPAATGVAAAPAEPGLANTGFDTRIVLLAGVALMAAGAALRFGLRPR